MIDKPLATVIQIKASDLHITVGQPPVVRHQGRMKRLDTKTLDTDDTVALMKSITPDRCQQELQEVGGTDFAIEFTDGFRFRVAVFKQRGNIGIVLRRIPSGFLSFDQIGMPDAIKRLITRPRGLLLVTGPTGSGKTTSLASMMNFINANYDKHIITLEDPIEYYHKHQKCTINQREIGVDVPSFKEGINAPAHGPRHHPRRRNARPGTRSIARAVRDGQRLDVCRKSLGIAAAGGGRQTSHVSGGRLFRFHAAAENLRSDSSAQGRALLFPSASGPAHSRLRIGVTEPEATPIPTVASPAALRAMIERSSACRRASGGSSSTCVWKTEPPGPHVIAVD